MGYRKEYPILGADQCKQDNTSNSYHVFVLVYGVKLASVLN